MLEADAFSKIMAQNNSNSSRNGMNAASFAEPYENRGLSMQNVESLRRMTTQQGNQQPPQPPQNNGSGMNQSSQLQQQQFPANPYLVMAQVPVQQAAALATFVNGQKAMQQQSVIHPQQQRQQQQHTSIQANPGMRQNQLASNDDSWTHLLQPTPLPPGHSHSHPSNVQQQQATVMSLGVQPQQIHASYDSGATISINDSNSRSMNNSAPQFDSTTMSFLQELMKNAASAALQQQQMVHPQQQQPRAQQSNQGGYTDMRNLSSSSGNQRRSTSSSMTNSINGDNMALIQQSFMQAVGGQGTTGAIPVDSSVGPVSRSDNNSNNIPNGELQGVEAWKQMWDSASKTMFQQQHQQLLKKVVPQLDQKLRNADTSASLPVQPAKRKFADFETTDPEQQLKKQHTSPTFHPLDSFGSASLDDDGGGVNDSFFDEMTPTPLSEIHARERSESLEAERQLQRQGSNNELTTRSRPQVSNYSDWQDWNNNQQEEQQQEHQTPLSPPVAQSQSLPTKAAMQLTEGQPLAPKQQAFILPSTMMPPTVLASTFTERQSTSPSRKKRQGAKTSQSETPYKALQRITQERGYGSKIRIGADEAGYDAAPSSLQLASFGTEVVKAVHTSNPERLSELLSAGLSPNPCNQFRDSIVDLVCKRANEEIFQCLIDHNCELRVCDGFGRTPLHHCCWASEFSSDIAHAVLKTDLLQLFIEDKRGQTPLEYVRPGLADSWVEFLEDHKDELFPFGGSVPLLTNVKDNRPNGSLPDPLNALPVPLAAAVSSGQVTTEQVKSMDARAKAQYGQ